jgi:RHS repeat-associated protein
MPRIGLTSTEPVLYSTQPRSRGFTYQYDNNGNLIRKTPKIPGPFKSYEYDAENKLVRAVINGTTVNYKYDGLGRRVEKEVISVGTTVTRYVYDNEDILLELDGSNNIVARYTHGPGIDEPLIMEKGGASFFYHADALGSITELANQSGAVVQRYAYSSFGKIESRLDPNLFQPYTYTSREFDPETGLYYYRSRYYDFSAGRFKSVDSIFNIRRPNGYNYVSNNPLIYIDPSGKKGLPPLCLTCLTLAAGAVSWASIAGCAVGCRGSCDYLGCFLDCFADPFDPKGLLKNIDPNSLTISTLACTAACGIDILERFLRPPPESGPKTPHEQNKPSDEIEYQDAA